MRGGKISARSKGCLLPLLNERSFRPSTVSDSSRIRSILAAKGSCKGTARSEDEVKESAPETESGADQTKAKTESEREGRVERRGSAEERK